jgi:predicted acyltransferase
MTTAAKRVPAFDLLRGAAVAGMILVTSPGDWAFTYSQLQHADWNEWTAADMVFPAFLFSVGVALGLSFPRPFGEAHARRSAIRTQPSSFARSSFSP